MLLANSYVRYYKKYSIPEATAEVLNLGPKWNQEILRFCAMIYMAQCVWCLYSACQIGVEIFLSGSSHCGNCTWSDL